MRVKDLVEATIWVPNKNKDATPPLVSVLLPTFEKAHNGFLKRVLDSIIAQSFRNFEVIIVDDASSDNTTELVKSYMDFDNRIHLLQHPKNIGLPAVSEWEALQRSTGKYIFFAFDDNFIYPNAFEVLLSAIDSRDDVLCYGNVRLISADGRSDFYLGQSENKNINIFNYVGNSAVLLPRKIINDVGFYDPHILMSRNCDWDLWQRIAQKYALEHHNVLVADEFGLSNNKSLGNTYPFDSWGNYFRRQKNRNRMLQPSTFECVDVFEVDEDFDYLSKITVSELAYNHAIKREWCDSKKDAIIIILYDGYSTATISHAFGFLPLEIKYRIRLVNVHTASVDLLSRASALIVVRGITSYFNWIVRAKELKIKVVYYVDDNLYLLSSNELKANGKSIFDSSLADVKSYECFDEVWCSTQNLTSEYKSYLPHKLVYIHSNNYSTISFPFDLEYQDLAELIVFGFIGGAHRLTSFYDDVVPQIQSLACEKKIRLIMAGLCNKDKNICEGVFRNLNIELLFIDFEPDWQMLMIKLRSLSCHFILHSSSDSINRPYKTDNALVCATYANAILCTDETAVYSDSHQAYISMKSWDKIFDVIKLETSESINKKLLMARAVVIGKSHSSRIFDLHDNLIYQVTSLDVYNRLIKINSNECLYSDRMTSLEEVISNKDKYISEKQILLDERYNIIIELQEMLRQREHEFFKCFIKNLIVKLKISLNSFFRTKKV